MAELRVEPDLLENASRVCEDLHAVLQRSAVGVQDETQAAISGLPGWRTRPALEQLSWSWSDDLSNLTGNLSKIGDALGDCARDYRYGDQASAALFDNLGR